MKKKKDTITELIDDFTKEANYIIYGIVKHYGIRHQLKKFNEEVFELNEAVIEYEESKYILQRLHLDTTKHIIEEIADVMVLLMQIQIYYKIDTCAIKKIVEDKIRRQLWRMENGK